jgi:S-adenosylmethionine/arginine decarboxylase-like enzyme
VVHWVGTWRKELRVEFLQRNVATLFTNNRGLTEMAANLGDCHGFDSTLTDAAGSHLTVHSVQVYDLAHISVFGCRGAFLMIKPYKYHVASRHLRVSIVLKY